MAVYHEVFTVESGYRVSFEDVTERVQEAVKKSGIKNGLVNVLDTIREVVGNNGPGECVFSAHKLQRISAGGF